jgi:nitrite reductase/ring-hydroxylating ferredoxin subunit
VAAGERLICAADAVQERGSGVRFEVDYCGSRQQAFVVRYDGVARAYLNQCAHVAVELDWNEGEFFDLTRLYLICSTHGALYDPATGRCISGRCAGRGLIALALTEHDGHLYLTESDNHHE